LPYIAVNDQLTALVNLSDLVLSIAMHVHLHAIVAATKVVTHRTEDIDSDTAGIMAEAISYEAMSLAVNEDESLPAGIPECYQFQR
jgi:hypothetical protein